MSFWTLGLGPQIQAMLRQFPGDSTLPAPFPEAFRLMVEKWELKIMVNLASGLAAKLIVYPYRVRRDVPIGETNLTTIIENDLAAEQKNALGVALPMFPSTPGVTPFYSPRLCTYLKFGKPKMYRFKSTWQGQGRQSATFRLSVPKLRIKRYHYTDSGANVLIYAKRGMPGLCFRFIGDLTNDNSGTSGPVLPKMVYSPADWNMTTIEKMVFRESSEQQPHYAMSLNGMSATGANAQVLSTSAVPIQSTHTSGNWNTYPFA